MEQHTSPLRRMTIESPTQLWNDSCAADELSYAMEHGAVGATTNPIIVGNVLKKEMGKWRSRIVELVNRELPLATEDDIAWKVNEEMAVIGAGMLRPIYDTTGGQKGRISIQTNTKCYRDPQALLAQASHFAKLAPNLHVKIPATAAGVAAIEKATAAGISINATVSFTVSQAVAVAEAVDRGLAQRRAKGEGTESMAPVCTIMVGRVDDWIKKVAETRHIVTNPGYLEWCGVAVVKNAYRIFRERGYRTKLLAAAYRNHMHWSAFVGGDLILTIPHEWQLRFNNSDVDPIPRMADEVDPAVLAELRRKFPDFRRAYDEDGLSIPEFDEYGATRRTLRQFLAGYDELARMIRDLMVTDPDLKGS